MRFKHLPVCFLHRSYKLMTRERAGFFNLITSETWDNPRFIGELRIITRDYVAITT